MVVHSGLMTVAEFSRLPQPAGGFRQELRHGEVVELPPVKKRHTRTQIRLVSLLGTVCHGDNGVCQEFPFRPADEYEVWIADVAVYSLARWNETADDDYFRGVPTIVAEILSPSNSASEMLDREEICLRHGGQEFWLVDPQRESVKVMRADGYSRVYGVAGVIESAALHGAIAVRDVFAG